MPTKKISLREKTSNKLDKIKHEEESYNDAVERLLENYRTANLTSAEAFLELITGEKIKPEQLKEFIKEEDGGD